MDFKADAQRMEKIVSLCKRRGFINGAALFFNRARFMAD